MEMNERQCSIFKTFTLTPISPPYEHIKRRDVLCQLNWPHL